MKVLQRMFLSFALISILYLSSPSASSMSALQWWQYFIGLLSLVFFVVVEK